MRGFPLREMLVLVLGLGLLGWPLYRVTAQRDRGGDEVALGGLQGEGEMKAAELMVRAAHPMDFLKVTVIHAGGREEAFHAKAGELGEGDFTQEISYAKEGRVAFKVEVEWPAGTPETAVMLRLEPEGEEGREWTFWGETTLVEEVAL